MTTQPLHSHRDRWSMITYRSVVSRDQQTGAHSLMTFSVQNGSRVSLNMSDDGASLIPHAVDSITRAFEKLFVEGKHKWVVSGNKITEPRYKVVMVEGEFSPNSQQYKKLCQSRNARQMARRVVKAGELITLCANILTSTNGASGDIDLRRLVVDGQAFELDMHAYRVAQHASQLPEHVVEAGLHGRGHNEDIVIIGGLCGVVKNAVRDAVSDFINRLNVVILLQSDLLPRIVAHSCQCLGNEDACQEATHDELVAWLIDAVTDYVCLSSNVEDPRQELQKQIEERRASNLTMAGIHNHLMICDRDIEQMRAFHLVLKYIMPHDEESSEENNVQMKTSRSADKVGTKRRNDEDSTPHDKTVLYQKRWQAAQDMLTSGTIVPELRSMLQRNTTMLGVYKNMKSLAEQYTTQPPPVDTFRSFVSEAHTGWMLVAVKTAIDQLQYHIESVESRLARSEDISEPDASLFPTYIPVLEIDSVQNPIEHDDFVDRVRLWTKQVHMPDEALLCNSTEVPEPTWRANLSASSRRRVRNAWVTSRERYMLPDAEYRAAVLSAVEFLLGCGYIEPGVFDARLIASRYNKSLELLTRFNELLADAMWVTEEMSNRSGIGVGHYITTRAMCDPDSDDSPLVKQASAVMRYMSAYEMRQLAQRPREDGSGTIEPMSGREIMKLVRYPRRPLLLHNLHTNLYESLTNIVPRGVKLPESFTWFVLDALTCAIDHRRLTLFNTDRRDHFRLAPAGCVHAECHEDAMEVDDCERMHTPYAHSPKDPCEVAKALRSVSILNCLFTEQVDMPSIRTFLCLDEHDCVERSVAEWRKLAGDTFEIKRAWEALDEFICEGRTKSWWGERNGKNVAFVRNASSKHATRRRIRMHVSWIKQYGANLHA